MADLIERNAVLAEIGEFQIRFNEIGDSHERVAYASAEHCMLVIKAAPAVNRWISVEDALPERNGCYLVWRPRFYIDGDRECAEATVCYFDGHDTWHDSYGVDFSRVLGKDDITHWMPLPDPPESEG